MSGLEGSKRSAFDAFKTLREELVYLALPDQFGFMLEVVSLWYVQFSKMGSKNNQVTFILFCSPLRFRAFYLLLMSLEFIFLR